MRSLAIRRKVVSRFGPRTQDKVVHAWARMIQLAHTLKSSERIPFAEYVVSAYDDITPMWRHYHTPIEVSRWFYECGFGPVVLTHWDNPYGFGVLGMRVEQLATPGMHFGTGAKLWDESRTIVG